MPGAAPPQSRNGYGGFTVVTNPAAAAPLPFNGFVAGGTSNLLFRDGQWAGAEPSLGGTLGNCAGGITPWGTWLSCEETILDFSLIGGKRHGYVFDTGADPSESIAEPIIGMGRFVHEAVAVDPSTGYVYETEDNRNAPARACWASTRWEKPSSSASTTRC